MKICLTSLIIKEMHIRATMRHYRSHKYKKKIKEYGEQLNALKFDKLSEMDKLLERHNMPKLPRKEINNINKLIFIKEIEAIIDSLPK